LNLASADLEALWRCRNIRYIDLNRSVMPVGFLCYLRSMPSLKGVNLHGTNIQNQDVEALKASLPQLVVEE